MSCASTVRPAGSYLSPTMPPSSGTSLCSDDWTRMESTADRRKTQNRMAQRKYSKIVSEPFSLQSRMLTCSRGPNEKTTAAAQPIPREYSRAECDAPATRAGITGSQLGTRWLLPKLHRRRDRHLRVALYWRSIVRELSGSHQPCPGRSYPYSKPTSGRRCWGI